jgi:gamma-glutamyltranspeptidase / glutathione hydrolase
MIRFLFRAVLVAAVLADAVLADAGAAKAASLPPTSSDAGLVVTAQHLASEAGIAMLRQGGNAIDAAVAVGYAEAVVNPCCGNIGGGGFMLTHLKDGRDVFLDFRETAPAAASRDMYLDAHGKAVPGASVRGWKAVAVPGTVRGLDMALRKYGTMSRAAVMAPAIRLAREGFVLGQQDADLLSFGARLLRHDKAAAQIFLHPDGSPLRAGEVLRQPDLANTLQTISDRGPDAFYTGAIPHAIEAASREGGGLIGAGDLATYQAAEAVPVQCRYRGLTVMASPPPSSGGTTLCETLNILEAYDLPKLGFHSAEAVHLTTEALRVAFFDRNTYLGDPAFVRNPINRLLSKSYAERLRGQISARATPSTSFGPAVPPAGEQAETTSYSIIDRAGNAVAVTYTLNGAFGAGVIAGDTGVLMNDEMDDFTVQPNQPNQYGLVQGTANAIEPGKRPLSSMAPTIVLRDGVVQMAVGSPGGPRIITAVLEAMLNVIDYGMNAQEAVDAPRYHHQWLPDEIDVERFALSPDTETLLRQMGYHLVEQPPWSAVAMIALAPKEAASTGAPPVGAGTSEPRVYQGAIDARRPGGAALRP